MRIALPISLLLLAAASSAQARIDSQAAWKKAREAYAESPNAASAKALLSAFQGFDRRGLLNVGVSEKRVLQALGAPDQSAKRGAITRHRFGFLVVACRAAHVFSLIDTRGMSGSQGSGSKGSESLRFTPSDARKWRPGHRYLTKNRFVTEYVLPGEQVQAWSQLVTHERYTGLAQRATASSFLASIRKQLAKIDPQHEWNELVRSDGKLVYEWVLHAKEPKRAQRELAALVFGKNDVHRLAFASKGAEIEDGVRGRWLETLRAVQIQSTPASKVRAVKSPITRRLAWELGSKLSIAAIVASKGADAKLVKSRFGMAETMARGLGVALPRIPALKGESSARYARVLGYLMKDMGPVADALRTRYGRSHSLLMSIAIKSNATLLLYNPKDDTAQTIADRAEKVCSEIELPQRLWKPAVDSIRARAPFSEVKAAIFKMHKEISAHLSPRRAGG